MCYSLNEKKTLQKQTKSFSQIIKQQKQNKKEILSEKITRCFQIIDFEIWLRPTCSLCKWQQWDLERVVMYLSNVQGHTADLEAKLKFLLSRSLQCELLSWWGCGYEWNGVKLWRPTGDLGSTVSVMSSGVRLPPNVPKLTPYLNLFLCYWQKENMFLKQQTYSTYC